ncbi:DoxX family protein [Oceanobacillus jeddahense]|uniref:DoxX family protein n=1 Tax=Oceanobacillus jeddahense TaxID=1462527 RepID=UPI000694D094|nr:hypothetical protein [Oceanobacillus jeddahense]
MQTLIIYCFGAFLGMIISLLFKTDHMLLTAAQFSIFISFLYTFMGRLIPAVRESLIQMVPAIFPFPKFIVYATGMIELLIAIGVFFPSAQLIASIAGIIICIVLFPANIKAFKQNIHLGTKPPTNIYVRLFVQCLFIASFILIAVFN